MRKIVSVMASVLILTGSYFAAFGVPASLGVIPGAESVSGTETNKGAGRLQRGSRGAGATTVVTAPLDMQPYEDVLRAVGSATALHRSNVIANAAGEVVEINLTANRDVTAGDVLVRLDARTQLLDLEIAQAELKQATDTVLRYERLRARGNTTITDVTLSDARVVERLAQAKVGLAEVALDDRTIKAPISGKLGLSDLEIGDIVSVDTAIVTIDDADALLVAFELPERSIAVLENQRAILASTPTFTGRVFDGEITSFDSRIDSVTRSVTVKARIENPEGVLWPGMTFAVRILQQSEPLAVLPSTAVTWSRSGSSVWIAKKGSAEQVPATILFRRNDRVWIDADISAGTMVITEGAQKLRPGSPIMTAEDAPQRETPRNAAIPSDADVIGADLPRPTPTDEPS